MFRSYRRNLLPTVLLTLTLCVLAPLARAASSVLIWPIDPVLESDRKASALWLENRGNAPVLMQVRVFAWTQADYEEQFQEQQTIIGSPPMIRIEPGKKQLIRLTRTVPMPAGSEQAYRIIIDEIPTPDTQLKEEKSSAAIKFQMRYSVPLFAYGDGLWFKEDPNSKRKRDPASAGQPKLSWKVVTQDGKSFLEVRNQGPVHARLARAALQQAGKSTSVSDGLLGYVLAHSSMRWPLAQRPAADASLKAEINSGKQLAEIPFAP
ncbi:Chaperone protein EcpD precursor [compost metagenome]